MATNNSYNRGQFPGFRRPTTTPIPDELFDDLMPILSGAEIKVVLYICRRTFGFKKNSDTISLNQIASGITKRDGTVLDGGTGLSKRHVQRALKTLEERNIIKVSRVVDDTGLNEINTYSLNILDTDHRVGTSSPHPRDKMSLGVETPVSTTTNSKQETEEQHDVVVREALQNFGISKSTADKLTKNFPEESILEKLDLAQWLVSTGSPTVAKNPAGWLRKAIEEDYTPPRNYESPKQKKEESARTTQLAEREAKERSIVEAEYRRVRAESRERLLQEFPPEPVGEGLTTHTAWELVLNNLKDQVGVASYETWLKDTVLLEVTGQVARIAVGTPHKIAWVERRLYQPITSALKDVLKRDLDLQFVATPLNTE
jgi:phage replication O-like protein O